MIKKNLIILFTFTLIFIQKVNSSEKDIYKKIDLFGEVLEKINKESEKKLSEDHLDEINNIKLKNKIELEVNKKDFDLSETSLLEEKNKKSKESYIKSSNAKDSTKYISRNS